MSYSKISMLNCLMRTPYIVQMRGLTDFTKCMWFVLHWGENMTNTIVEEIAQTVFIVFSGLMFFFSGYLVTVNLALSFILLLLGLCASIISVEYNKEDDAQ